MEYNTLLQSLSDQITNANKIRALKEDSVIQTPTVDDTSTILNKIGLEVQRQGGF